MARIILRSASNDFDALRTAQGMENAGASVFSISHAGMHQPWGAMIPSAKFVVWAKYDEPLTADQIDAAISHEFGDDEDEEGDGLGPDHGRSLGEIVGKD